MEIRHGQEELREYSREFELEALELLKKGDKSAVQIGQELGVMPGLLVKWRSRYQIQEKEGKPAQIGPSDLEAAKAEICRLQRELSPAEEERKILKKVLNISSRKIG